jgi:phosphatidylserine decarboxylase
LIYVGIAIVAIAFLLWYLTGNSLVFKGFCLVMAVVYLILINFFRCPIRYFQGETDGIVVAPADGRVVVIEEVEETEYFHDRRLMVSIFMSLFNVHANWFPVDGRVKFVKHFNGNFHKAWLPKASEENEHADIMLETDEGEEILCRQIAGAVARRIVTYAKDDEDCYIDEHLGFIKFGSRVDVYLPLGTEVCVTMGQSTTGDQTVIARLPRS